MTCLLEILCTRGYLQWFTVFKAENNLALQKFLNRTFSYKFDYSTSIKFQITRVASVTCWVHVALYVYFDSPISPLFLLLYFTGRKHRLKSFYHILEYVKYIMKVSLR